MITLTPDNNHTLLATTDFERDLHHVAAIKIIFHSILSQPIMKGWGGYCRGGYVTFVSRYNRSHGSKPEPYTIQSSNGTMTEPGLKLEPVYGFQLKNILIAIQP